MKWGKENECDGEGKEDDRCHGEGRTEGANFSGLKINIISSPAKLKLWPTLPSLPLLPLKLGEAFHLNPFAYPPDRRLVVHPLCTSGFSSSHAASRTIPPPLSFSCHNKKERYGGASRKLKTSHCRCTACPHLFLSVSFVARQK